MTTDELLAAIKRNEATYKPDARIAERLQQVNLVSLLGPMNVGKTTVIRTASKLDSDFARVVTFMTRARRDDEEPDLYKFLKHDHATLGRILRQIENHELVQFIVHPTTGRVYGSHIAAYTRPFMLLETLPAALKSLEKLPFRQVRKIAIAADPAEWRARFMERSRHDSKDDMSKRLKEGIANLSWSLDHSDQVTWLDNSQKPVEETARQLIAIVKYDAPYDDTAARHTGEALLAVLKSAKIR